MHVTQQPLHSFVHEGEGWFFGAAIANQVQPTSGCACRTIYCAALFIACPNGVNKSTHTLFGASIESVRGTHGLCVPGFLILGEICDAWPSDLLH